MRWLGLFSVLPFILTTTSAIFADDAFHIDYSYALLGEPQSHTTSFHRPHTSTNASLLYTLSDKAILGAVNPRDGSLLWRQPLAGQPVENATSFLVRSEGDGQVVSGHNRTVACWDALDGRLIWEYTLSEGHSIHGLQAAPALESSSTSGSQDVLVLTLPTTSGNPAIVLRVAGDGSGLKWEHVDSSHTDGSIASIAVSPKHLYYITKSHGLLASSKAKVVTLDSTTGHEMEQASVALDSEALRADGDHVFGSGSSFPFLLSSEKPYKSVKFNLLGSSKVATIALDDKGDSIERVTVHVPESPAATPHFLLHVQGKTRQWAEVFHVDVKSGEATKAYSLPATDEKSAFAASSNDASVYFTRVAETEILLYSSESHGQLGRWRRTSTQGHPVHVAAEVVSRGKAAFAVRVAELSSTGAWSLIRNGEVQWTRPEVLAYATIAAWGQNGASDPLAQELDLELSVNPLTAYVHRLKRHLLDLVHLPLYLQDISKAIIRPSTDADEVARKDLVGSQRVIVGTSRNELIALDVTNGGVIMWQKDLSTQIPDGVEMKSITVTDGRATIYLSDGSLLVANAADGIIIEHQPGSIPVSDLVQIPGSPAHAIIKVDSAGTPHPANDFAPSNPLEGNVVVTVSDDGQAIGWTIGQTVEKTWILKLQTGFKVTSIVARPEHDPVASIGRVLGDRSVLYKYLSPNIALLIAQSKTDLLLYLVDAVTGAILHTSKHHGILSGSPIPAVLSENWFAYSFTSHDTASSALSTQIVVSELYESSAANDRGALASRSNYSSFSPDARTNPHVISQAFTVAEPISHLEVSQTAQGITSRQLLATLPNSNAIVGIPREILDARRPVDRDPTANEREEGLMRYSPVLDLDPKWFLTHSREVLGVQKVISAPTLLESTSLVFAFGHDMFGTQITPSQSFDVLGKGFNKLSLMLTVVALAVGVLALRPLVRTKTVEGRWKQ
ncbi:hypothetical protein LTR10_015215 [Elasticomyces elasticus]|uniref:ER membrane protein complex subunit 1 n=1 Tax=Exophiala sideris TaxID=1016849 RepID=A0ABR0JE73_9EURO|nr:hypothetical protein LTR10_015215 [Elasticomyces elasticus]KAK5032690.1 hypothetical protein LTS07_004100 [Exophiala sideris]KAK5037130.1 hypothetical protein LTR13_004935 [Exophiala sideris]KAK5062214.1 hypothetical protein LTR69_004572 [Exophiala sideris]KAK5182288.1 hypothetical protein LTR44_005299 [Eurotiomycetes sp. CCFEE 6388]